MDFACGTEFLPANCWYSENGQNYALIDNLQSMDPFFFSIVGAGNHWLFCGSNGALSAGRCSPETALFPYYTVDKILDNWNSTGPWTAMVTDGQLWHPFSPSLTLQNGIRQRLMKSDVGDEVIFEETNEVLGLRYSYRWQLSERFGFVRRSRIENIGDAPRELRMIDGLDNLMPAGVDSRTQNEYSCLADAYKTSELLSEGSLLVHRLAAGITDEAMPMESLLATTVWTTGLEQDSTYLTRKDAEKYLKGGDPDKSDVIRARRGAMFLARNITLKPGEAREWVMVSEINQTQADVAELVSQLKNPKQLDQEVRKDIIQGRKKLRSFVASADGVQRSADRDVTLYHYQNTLYNILRGGVPANGYIFHRSQFASYLKRNNQELSERCSDWLACLPEELLREELLVKTREFGDADLIRLAEEYLPLILSRRHGDPSRPWNKFAIRLQDEEGEPILHFEGNWRDIFQNWEALGLSYPQYLGAFITKFLNASTVDGYNPYRITSEGVDWEAPDEDDPWASIGYWGDHQIIYLLKLLELQSSIQPEALAACMNDARYVFADVPYRLKTWEQTLADPRETISFDTDRHNRLIAEKERNGGDALLLKGGDGKTIKVTLVEKLLLPAVVKMANLVPGGGIWMNTQRPEWNDANNALAGYGLSVVTAGYLHRYLGFLERFIGGCRSDRLLISSPLADLMEALSDVLMDEAWEQKDSLSGADRFSLMERTGLALEAHRTEVYQSRLEKLVPVSQKSILIFLSYARRALKQTLRNNQREDGLYHSYNILEIDRSSKTMDIGRLSVMLEGQVSILSSEIFEPEEAASLLKVLASSPLVSERHRSYLLYPDREPSSFLEGNRIEKKHVVAIESLAFMMAEEDSRLVVADPTCGFRFNPSLTNSYELAKQLDTLVGESELGKMLANDRSEIEILYEATFNHQSFTGRSGSMFGYEGLGCIYWHMISKLMLAVQEVSIIAAQSETNHEVRQQLISAYYAVQSGLGFRKPAQDYGAFPAEAYSHSPAHTGAQQPGLTGQVKEGILCRFGELGVIFKNGVLRFRPQLLRDAEFANEAGDLPVDTLSFSIMRTKVVYHRCIHANKTTAKIFLADESEHVYPDALLDESMTSEIVRQTGRVQRIEVEIPASWLISS